MIFPYGCNQTNINYTISYPQPGCMTVYRDSFMIDGAAPIIIIYQNAWCTGEGATFSNVTNDNTSPNPAWGYCSQPLLNSTFQSQRIQWLHKPSCISVSAPAESRCVFVSSLASKLQSHENYMARLGKLAIDCNILALPR